MAVIVATLLVLSRPLAAIAADPTTVSPNGSPGAAAPPAPICTDRPTKSNYACTVDAGHFQYEADLFNATHYRTGGTSNDTWLLFNPTLKYGVTSNADVEANIAAVDTVHLRDGTGQPAHTGVGDLYLRLKYRFVSVDGGRLQIAALPYLKVPTARNDIGNGAVETGMLFPVNYRLTDSITLTAAPELDVLKNSDGQGRHVSTSQLVNVAIGLPHNFTAYAELWGSWNFDHSGTVRQYSADVALAYGVTPLLQVDVGLNFGLNRSTPDIQGYVGLSQKF